MYHFFLTVANFKNSKVDKSIKKTLEKFLDQNTPLNKIPCYKIRNFESKFFLTIINF